MASNIFVTQPTIPDINSLIPLLSNIFKSGRLTNNGEMHNQLTNELTKYLNVNNLTLCSSGTFALYSALSVLNLTGEIITTPYTFAATTNVLHALNLKPIFVDVLYNGCIDPSKIENAITNKTSAILAVHTYGNPCNVNEIDAIAKKYNLKVIYDAAHAFNVKINNESILNFGDASAISFHATKIYNTIEGGAIISNSKELVDRVSLFNNFGIINDNIVLPGLNGKLDEIRSAIGILNLKTIESNINKCKNIAKLYLQNLNNIDDIDLPVYQNNIDYNYSYFPIYVKNRDVIFNVLQRHNIMVKKYFYPLITNTNLYKDLKEYEIASKLADSVLCLPIYPTLTTKDVEYICNIIKTYT